VARGLAHTATGLRRGNQRPASLRFGCAEIRPAERRLLLGGQPAMLGARALDLSLALVEENNLQVQISTLRKLLGPQVIATVFGRGYRFALENRDATPAAASN
jgi:DNA-binding response OmpR family regulator